MNRPQTPAEPPAWRQGVAGFWVTKAPPVFPAHWARVLEFHGRGDLLMVGTFADAQEDGSMAIFTTRESAEEFVKDDPFVRQGVVRKWRILDWNEAFSPD